MFIDHDKLNDLPLEKYKWVFAISDIHRPSELLLSEKIESLENAKSKTKKKQYKDELKYLIKFWDNYFPNSSSDSKGEVVEEWIEEAFLFRSSIKFLKHVYIKLPNEPLPKELKTLPYIGKIPGRNPHLQEQNSNLDNDLLFPELQKHLGREIITSRADPLELIEKSEQMLSKYDCIYLKWLGVPKVYPVKKVTSIAEVNEYIEFDPYMFEIFHNKQISIQQGLDLVSEVRFFVIGGEIAGYSYTDWFRTPLDRYVELFSHLEYKAKFITKANSIILDLKFGSVTSQTYVMDLAYNLSQKEIVLVELNPIHNSGLYGIDTDEFVIVAKKHPEEFKLRNL